LSLRLIAAVLRAFFINASQKENPFDSADLLAALDDGLAIVKAEDAQV